MILRQYCKMHVQRSDVLHGMARMQNEELQELQVMSQHTKASGQGTSHSSRVVDNLRVQLNGTTSNFKSVLEVRRETLKTSQDRRSRFTSSGQPAGMHFPVR